jgi:hypothetical protein
MCAYAAGKGEETPSILHEFGHEELDYPIFRRMSTVSLGDRPCVAFAPAAVGDTDKPLTEFRAYDEDVCGPCPRVTRRCSLIYVIPGLQASENPA